MTFIRLENDNQKFPFLILIGYRATGKSTVAKILGAKLDIPVLDSDPEIERQSGKSIADIFAREGETAFRDRESKILADILNNTEGPMILATGGGAILRPENRRLLRQSGHVVWLTASPETILRRLQGDPNSPTTRPSLTDLPAAEEIIALLEKRRPLYEETSHRMIDTETLAAEEIAEMICGEIPKRNR